MRRPARALGLLLMILAVLLTTAGGARATTGPGEEWGATDLVLFWGDGCPHCAAEKEWLQQAEKDFPRLSVIQYEVWYDAGNRTLLAEVAAERGFEVSGVPVTLLGDRVWIGWSEAVAGEITAYLEAEGAGEPGEVPSEPAAPTDPTGTTVDVPFMGEVTLGESLIASTLIIGFVDGMNPCSLWVITVLLAIVVRTGARGRVVAIGTTYLLATALMYGLFILGVYSALGLIAHLGAVQVVVAVVAGMLGLVSVKDYFAFKQGVSMTISDAAKPGLYRRMRGAAGQEALLPALGATVVLAVGVSFIEIPCTAGFPLLWAGLLEANDVGFAQGLGLLVLFMVPYLLDELVVFGLAVLTMRSLKMQERHGRLLKLLAGTMMIALAGTMLIAPEAMTRPVFALVLFVGAAAVAALVHLLVSRLRPEEVDAALGNDVSGARPGARSARR